MFLAAAAQSMQAALAASPGVITSQPDVGVSATAAYVPPEPTVFPSAGQMASVPGEAIGGQPSLPAEAQANPADRLPPPGSLGAADFFSQRPPGLAKPAEAQAPEESFLEEEIPEAPSAVPAEESPVAPVPTDEASAAADSQAGGEAAESGDAAEAPTASTESPAASDKAASNDSHQSQCLRFLYRHRIRCGTQADTTGRIRQSQQ
jgi:hypothetical protein